MPEISRFFGIVIRMYYDEHAPPHFHAEYGSQEIVLDIRTLAVMAGSLPPRAIGLVTEWANMHQDELMIVWNRARNAEPLEKIEPLK